MGIGFKKSYKMGPFKLNLSKDAVGVSLRMGPFSQSINSKGRGRTSATLPSTGVFYRKYESFDNRNEED